MKNKLEPDFGFGRDVYGNLGVDGKFTNPAKRMGVYRGVVEDNQDPKEQGRVRVRVPEFHGIGGENAYSIGTKSLPWAHMINSSAGFGYGSYVIPEVGEFVLVMFENGDIYMPVVIGSLYGSGSREPKDYGSGTNEDDEAWKSIEGVTEVAEENLRMSPSLKTLYRSPTGAAITVDERREEENICMEDGLGQFIKISSNMKKDCIRKGPESFRDSDHAEIEIEDYNGQRVLFESEKEKSRMTIQSTDGYDIMLAPDESGLTITAKDSKITLDTSGTITITSSNNVVINSSDRTSITSSGPLDLFGDPVYIGSPVIFVDGVEDASSSYNSHNMEWMGDGMIPLSDNAIVAYALQFVGNNYQWGGNNPNVPFGGAGGIDCSHFVTMVLQNTGHWSGGYLNSTGWRSAGVAVPISDIQPGDVVCYPGHVAIYAGNGKIVEAQGKAAGITSNRGLRPEKVVTVRRVI